MDIKKHLMAMWPKPTDVNAAGKVRIKRVKKTIAEVRVDEVTGNHTLDNKSWHFDVTYAFREALNIKYERRQEKNVGYMAWTQGPIIKFHEGDVIVSRVGDVALQVRYAEPMGWDYDIKEMFVGSIVFDVFDIDNGAFIYNQRYQTNQMDFLQLLVKGCVQLEKEHFKPITRSESF